MLTRKTHLARPGVFGQHDRPPADLPPDAGGNLPSNQEGDKPMPHTTRKNARE